MVARAKDSEIPPAEPPLKLGAPATPDAIARLPIHCSQVTQIFLKQKTIGLQIIVALALVTYTDIGSAQVGEPRSRAYNFASTSADVRAAWSNPAGLSVIPEASVMAEARQDFPEGSDTRIGQYSLGFSSRGLAFVFQKDRFLNGLTGNTFRLGLSSPFKLGAVGLAISLYHGSGGNKRDADVGVRFRPRGAFDFGFVVRHIGRPTVRGETLPLTAVGSVNFTPWRRAFLAAEITAAERTSDSDVELGYRLRASISHPRLRAGGLVLLEWDDGLNLARLHFGISLGDASVVSLGTVVREPRSRFQTVSFTGVASRILRPRP